MSLTGVVTASHSRLREIPKDLELKRANHCAIPCAVERRNEGNARSDENKGKNRCEQGQTQTKHEWDGMGDGDGRNRLQMAGYDANDSHSQVGDVTKYRALCSTHQLLVTRPTRSQVRINAGMLCDSKKPSVRDMERVKRIGR